MPVSRDEGRFLYMTARVIGARNVVEFGSSFGISTLHLASAMKDSGGGMVITTEIEPSKCRATEHNLREAGLDAYARVIEGDATKTLQDVEGPIDLLFLDGWKDLYLTVLQMLLPRLRKGAVVIADNVRFPDARPYVDYVRDPSHGFISMSMFKNSLEYSCWMG
ncbi:MAG: class I SAM-dependent methyltransferase [Myxococcales bacterium]|nr:class I SAM-dependent methyltransferase [Myxococcales bacterium]